MILTAKVEKIFPVEKGVSKSGKEWKKGSFLVDFTSNPDWPKKLLITTFGKGVENVMVKEGESYDFDVDATSREWRNPNTGKSSWFTEVTAFKATPVMTEGSQAMPSQNFYSAPLNQSNLNANPSVSFGSASEDELPF